MAGLTYTQFKEQIANLAVVPVDNPEFLIALPQAIEYAQLRMTRDLDFLNTTGSFTTTLTGGTRRIELAPGTIVVSEQINLLLPAGNSDPETSERWPLTPTTKELIDSVYGNASYRSLPEWFAAYDDNVFVVGPYADSTYYAEVVGTVRFPLLSDANPTNFISLYLPDLMIMATMIWISAYQRNFGSASGDPAMGITFESQYQALLQSAQVEESRKKYEAAAWSSQSPTTVATPAR